MRIIILFISVIIFISCEEKVVQVEFDQKTFIEQRQLWQESNIKNYQYQFSVFGNPSYHGTIFVENRTFKYDSPLDEYSDIANFIEYSTIDDIYNTIENTFNLYNNTKQSIHDAYYSKIIVEYDKINNIPISISYRYTAPPDVWLDGPFDYEITNFGSK